MLFIGADFKAAVNKKKYSEKLSFSARQAISRTKSKDSFVRASTSLCRAHP